MNLPLYNSDFDQLSYENAQFEETVNKMARLEASINMMGEHQTELINEWRACKEKLLSIRMNEKNIVEGGSS